MLTRIRVLLLTLPTPPKSFAEVQARRANSKQKDGNISDPQCQALADKVDQRYGGI